MPTRRPASLWPPRGAANAAIAALTAGVLLLTGCGKDDDRGEPAPSGSGSPTAAPAPSPTSTPPPGPAPAPTDGWNTAPASVAALGDSITRGFDACSLLSDCLEASWVTGTRPGVRSLAERLLDDPENSSWNYARSGALMAELPAQAEKAAVHEPELVTILIGANDACRREVSGMTSVDAFRADFTEAMRTLRQESPDSQVYVASVPDLKRLWSQGRGNPQAAQVWQLGICQSMLRDPQADDRASAERREKVHRRVQEYNTALEEVCATYERCRHDAGAVHGYRFTSRELSAWDWFHPSLEGQRRLAEIAHRQITAPRAPR